MSSAPVTLTPGGYHLDKKYVEGLNFFSKEWGPGITAIMPTSQIKSPFGRVYTADELPFDIRPVESLDKLQRSDFNEAGVVAASGDNFLLLGLPGLVADPKRLVYTIENIPETRARINRLEIANPLRLLKSAVWLWRQERRRLAAFRAAGALQANGFPAFEHYSPIKADTLLFLDNRVGANMLVTPEEQARRAARLRSGAPLRLVNSGRLERIKGAQDIPRIVERLRTRGVNFHLDVFGTGSLEAEVRRIAKRHPELVTMHGVVDFATQLMPFCRQYGDVFLSCHRQSDPSCTYIESFGCGMPVVGYDNRMLDNLRKASGGAFVVPLGDVGAMVEAIGGLDAARERLVEASRAARQFCAEHLFETEFKRRIDHLRAVAHAA